MTSSSNNGEDGPQGMSPDAVAPPVGALSWQGEVLNSINSINSTSKQSKHYHTA